MATISRTAAKAGHAAEAAEAADDVDGAAVVRAVIGALRDIPGGGALLPILHGIQEQLGYVPPAAIEVVAEALNLSRAEVHGVVTFYHDFRSAPPGKHVLKVCRAEACQAVGCAALDKHLQDRNDAAKDLTVEPIYCLGNCALGPSVQLDGRIHGKVTPQRLDALLQAAQAKVRA